MNLFRSLICIILQGVFALSLGAAAGQQGRVDRYGFYAINLPGQNMGGGEHHEAYRIINTVTKRYRTLGYERPRLNDIENIKNKRKIDLGQDNCIASFEQQIKDDPSANVPGIKRQYFGTSQGTATVINSLAQKSHEEQEQDASSIVLQSVLGHGDSAIMHTAEHMVSRPLAYLPFARFWIPRVAGKVIFPTYNAKGKQAIDSARKISPKIPVVIMHDKNDPQLSINDARQVYNELRKAGNDNAYLIETEGYDRHLNILSGDPQKGEKIAAMQSIYKKYNLPYEQTYEAEAALDEARRNGFAISDRDNQIPQNVDLRPYQPSVQEVEKRINDSTWKSRWTRNAIDIAAGAAIIGGVVSYFYKKNN